MAGRVAPYIDNTGLVFAYDQSNTVRSYLGEPTTNMWGIETGFNVNQRSGWDMPYAYNGAITNSVYSSGTWNGNRIWEVLHTAGTSGYGGYESWRLCVNQPTAGTGTYSTTRRVAIKICVLEGSITDMALHSGGGNGSHNGADWTAIPEYEVPADCPVKSGWYQFLADGSWNSNSVGHCVGLGFISYNRVKILTTEPMYYPSNHLIPFTGYQRSATQGLKDLTGRSTIDLSNVSFDSSAQMTFDGTDDYVGLAGFTQPSNPNIFSVEAVVKLFDHNAGTNIGSVIVNNYSSLNGWIFFLNGPNSKLSLRHHNGSATSYNVEYSSGINLNQWYHIAATDDGAVVRIYLNGTQVVTGTSATSTNYSGQPLIGQFGGGNAMTYGNITVVRIYNRTLSASEIQQNFNAVRGRYGI